MKISILIPCYNEEMTIAKVVQDFRNEIPQADIYVYDNASTDRTAQMARGNGAIVRSVSRRGKGAVVRAMFRDIDSDVYVLVDGDDTYPATSAKQLIDPVASGVIDMTVGDRHAEGGYSKTAVRPFHGFGNVLVTRLINLLFRCRLSDIMSGYRAFNRSFVKSCPILTDGFEVETVMTLHALDKMFRVKEIPIVYRDRPAGSVSKLSTVADGLRVLRTILWIFKDCKPLVFFLSLSMGSLVLALAVGVPVLVEFMQTRYIHKIPSAVLASGLAIISFLLLGCGFILDTIVKIHREDFEVQLLNRRSHEPGEAGNEQGEKP